VCTVGSFHRIKRPEPEADPAPLSKAEVKMQDAMHPFLHETSSPGAQLSTGTLPLYVIYSPESNYVRDAVILEIIVTEICLLFPLDS
jgi:hypothetical protein